MRRGVHRRTQRTLRQREFNLDNFALVPASLLPFKDEWQRIAADLPSGGALLVVPPEPTPLKRCMRLVALQLRRRGRHVASVDFSRFPSTQ